MSPRGKKIKDITDFWADTDIGKKNCACGGKPEYHEFCGECWERYGKQKYLEETKKELNDGIWEKARSETNLALRMCGAGR